MQYTQVSNVSRKPREKGDCIDKVKHECIVETNIAMKRNDATWESFLNKHTLLRSTIVKDNTL